MNYNTGHEANKRASESNLLARIVVEFKEYWLLETTIVREWHGTFINSAIGLSNLVAVISGALEIKFTLPMYQDIVNQSASGNIVMAFIPAGLVVFLGALASHLISIKNQAVYEHNVLNKLRFSPIQTGRSFAEERVKKATRYNLLIGIIIGVVLLIIVTLISNQRVLLLNIIQGQNLGLLHQIIPPVCVITEIISGFYITYTFRLSWKKIKVWRYKKKIDKIQRTCAYETQMAYELYQTAMSNNESLQMTKDLEDMIERYEHRSPSDPNYCDPVLKK